VQHLEQELKSAEYSNSFNVAFGPYDFHLSFAQVLSRHDGDVKISLTEMVMSPQHFKATAQAMVDNLRKYEDIFGVINLQPDQAAIERLQAEEKGNSGGRTK
jgi:hypothetical protein